MEVKRDQKTEDAGRRLAFDMLRFSAWWTGDTMVTSPLFENAVSTKLELPPVASWVLRYTEC